ncbi:MAG: TraR/DksA C4-type zinc finger protein [Chitinophagaceae bacterium]|jgi:RNA polymerase-binding transcription factor DksA|nr:TraR/DksA C4-type zinc finger protein [Chitinophagaceae bacterium]
MATAKKTAAATKKPAAKKAAKAAPAKVKTAPVKKAAAVKSSKSDKKTAVPAKAVKPSVKAAPAKAASAKKGEKVPQKKVSEKKASVKKETVVKANLKEPKVEKMAKKVETPVEAPVKKASKKEEPAKPVKLPKITAQGKVPYEPDFTHSVLDGPKAEAPVTTPTQRYSDSDLAEFRELINRKLETARKELAYLQGLITRKDDSGGDGEDGRYMTMEDGTLSMEREQLSQMASRQITFIDHLEKAMIRIENKTYGICRETGKLIDKARLRAVPHATLSVEAKMKKSR